MSAFLYEKEETSMKELVMLIRPEKLEDIKKILDDINCGGMTLSTVMGCGTQKGISSDDAETVNELKGFKTTINLLPKVKVEVVVEDRFVEQIVEKVMEVCATDHVGDGKIFIKDVLDAVRIRTGERGTKAL
jgi:nitrogen regulatory protein P-II 1